MTPRTASCLVGRLVTFCVAGALLGACSSGSGQCLNPQPLPPFCGSPSQPRPPAGFAGEDAGPLVGGGAGIDGGSGSVGDAGFNIWEGPDATVDAATGGIDSSASEAGSHDAGAADDANDSCLPESSSSGGPFCSASGPDSNDAGGD